MDTSQTALLRNTEAVENVRFNHGVMEGGGAYNKHGQPQAAVAASATSLLEKAIQRAALEPVGQAVIIADYGSSQGKNSLAPIGLAVRGIRGRIGPDTPICVFHIDQRSNDFNTLFQVLSSDPSRYLLNQVNVYPCAIGRSFYERVLPPESVHLGWSANAAMWLSRIPSLIPGHFWSFRSTGVIREAFDRQAAEDWESFLSLRAGEMRFGARLVVVLPTVPHDESSGIAHLMDHANAVLQDMVDEGAITPEERTGMVLGSHPRRKDQLLLPFANGGRFRELVVEDYSESMLADPAWTEYRETHDKQALAAKRALFFRTTFAPSLASALSRVRNGDREALCAFADRLQEGLTERIISEPAPYHLLAQTVVLSKCC